MARPPESPPRRRRRWFLISLRGLMILVLIVGGSLGWVSWKIRKVEAQRQAVAAILKARGMVFYDQKYANDLKRLKPLASARQPWTPLWLRQRLGDDYFVTPAEVWLRNLQTPDLLHKLTDLPNLSSVRVEASADLDDHWFVLAELTHLEEAWLSGPGVTAPALTALGSLGSLRSLTLDHCPKLTDAEVARLLMGGLPKLEEFSWSGAATPIPLTMRALADHHPRLRHLALIQSAVEDADLAPIEVLTGLTLLNLQQTRITDAGLSHLAPLAKLESLTINLRRITDQGMKPVARLRNLRFLDLAWSQVGDLGLAELGNLTALTTLRLRRTRITDASGATLARIPALEVLLLNNTSVTDLALLPLRKLPSLRVLGLGGTATTSAGLNDLRSHLPNLLGPTPPAISSIPPSKL